MWRTNASIAQRQKRASRYARAFGRYRAKWLLLREALGHSGEVAWELDGTSLYFRLNSTDISVWASVFDRQEYGTPMSFRPRFILDAGAYTGLSAVYFARKYPDARIAAVEPDISNFHLLKKNARAFPNIVPLHKALWYADGPVSLYDRHRGHWAFSVTPPDSDGPSSQKQVDALTVSTIMSMFNTDRIDILKIDVEGAEKEIFAHSDAWIGHVRVIFVELHDRLRPGCTEAFESAMTAFRCERTGPLTILAFNERQGGVL
jgi:FkbM family methyltransferase